MALTMKNKELIDKLNSTTMQRENERFDIGNLNRKIQTLQNEMDKVLKNLEGSFDSFPHFSESISSVLSNFRQSQTAARKRAWSQETFRNERIAEIRIEWA